MNSKPIKSEQKAGHAARTLAPDDVCSGQYIAVLNELVELPSFLWCGEQAGLDKEEPIRLKLRSRTPGYPYQVAAVCLPFVCLQGPQGEVRNLDLRQTQIVLLAKGYAKESWKLLTAKRTDS